MTVNFRGYLFNDAGIAVVGADVDLFDIGTTNPATGTTTDSSESDGLWKFDNVANGHYDVRITSNSSVRWIRGADQIQLKEIDVRNNTGNTTAAGTFTNYTNNVANQVAVFSGANSSRADGDVIYISYELANSAGEQTEFARMIVEAEDTHNGSEDGAIRFQVMRDGTLATVWEVKSTGDGDVDAPTMSFDLNMDSLSIGNGADTDIVLTFDANTSDGVITWMEDEDYFKFSDEILMNGTEKILFGDTATFIHQSSDGVMTVDGEATIDLNASTAVLVSNDLKLNSDSAVLGFGADNDTTLTHTDGTGLTLNSTNKLTFGDTGTFIHQSSDGVLTITSDTTVDINGAVVFDGAITGATNITLSGELDAATLDLSSSADIAGDLVLSGGADGALQFTNAGENSIKIPDNQASALIIEEANNAYITFVTTNSSEAITVAKATTFSAGIANAGTIAAGTWNGTDVGVAYGGTGASSLTDGGVLLGSGTGAITAMAVLADSEMIVGDGTTDPVAESGATLRTSIGVGTGDSPQFTDLTLTDDLTLNSDSSVFNMGAGSDFKITHDGTTGATISGNPVTITSAGAATWSTSAGVLTIDGDDGIVMQTTGSGGVDIKEDLTLTSVDGGATGPILKLFHDTGSASATGGQDTGDRLGVIDFLDTDGTIRGEISCALEGNTSQAGFHFRLAGDATNDKLYINRDGNATLLGTLTESSDERLKANVATLTGSLAKVKQMRGVSFTRNDLTDKTQTHLGLIAQELELIASELVSTGANGFKAVAYSQLTAYLIEAIKELDTRIAALE